MYKKINISYQKIEILMYYSLQKGKENDCSEGFDIPNSVIVTAQHFQPNILQPFSTQVKLHIVIYSIHGKK